MIQARRAYVTALADYMHGLDVARLSAVHIDHAQLVISDTLGTILGGAPLPEIRALHGQSASLGGNGPCTIIGGSASVAAPAAAMINTMAGISLELDEGSQFATNHPAIHILPAALAVGEAEKSSGQALITALVGGYEIAARIGRATRLRKPVHPFGTHAICGAAAASAKLMGLDPPHIAAAIEIAAGLAISSSQTAANAGASVRNAAAGATAANGVTAAILARAGVTGEAAALEKVFGEILGDGFKTEGICEGLGDDAPFIMRNYFKIYACSRWNHAPIEAAQVACGGKRFAARDIAAVTVWTYSPATRLNWQEPANGYAAKHSIPYNVAAQIARGVNDLSAYTDDAVNDANVRALALKTTVIEDPEFTALVPDVRAARVDITLTGGDVLSGTVHRARGGFDNPFAGGVLMAKFRTLAALTLAPARIVTLEEAISQLPTASDTRQLMACMQV